jgi:hypothetical protein
MATGIEMYRAVKQATAGLIDTDFAINTEDASDLLKLSTDELQAEGYDLAVAEEVVSALGKSDYRPLGRTMGRISFVPNYETARLVLR